MIKKIWLLLLLIFISCNETKLNEPIQNNKPSELYKKAYHLYKNYQLDSAYFYFHKALEITNKKQDSLYIAKIHLNLAAIDYYRYNLPEAEYNAVQTLQYAPENNIILKAKANNLLGLTSKAKENYTEALQYFNKYRKFYLKNKDTILKSFTFYNNTGNVYKEMKKYDKAIENYDIILKNKLLKNKYPIRYAKALDNKAWCEYLKNKNNKKVLNELQNAYQIRKNENDMPGIVTSDLHLATYFYDKKNNLKATQYIHEAIDISKKKQYSENLLQAIDLLMKIKPEKAKTLHFYSKKIQDSVLKAERNFKEYTAKIRFKSLENEKKFIQTQAELQLKTKTNNWLKIVIFLIFSSLIFFLYLYRKILDKNNLLNEQTQKLAEQNRLLNKQKLKLLDKNKYISVVHKEMHHRIKNNFLNIFKFLSDIEKAIKSLNALQKLKKLKNIILYMHLIHEKLKDNPIHSEIYLYKYLNIVIDRLKENLDKNIKIIYTIDNSIKIPYKFFMPILAIIDEFVSNSTEHAFDKQPNPEIIISFVKEDGKIKMELSDNGKGLPESFDINKVSSDGLKLIYDMIEQLGGKKSVIYNNGLKIIVKF